MMETYPQREAECSGVSPALFDAEGAAFAPSNEPTHIRCPNHAARCRAESPLGSTVSGTPASRRRRSFKWSPFFAALRTLLRGDSGALSRVGRAFGLCRTCAIKTERCACFGLLGFGDFDRSKRSTIPGNFSKFKRSLGRFRSSTDLSG